MKLYEYEAKSILGKASIPVLQGKVIERCEDGLDFFKKNSPVVLKSQVLTGGRGKAGGIKFAHTEEEFRKECNSLLALSIKGLPVRKLLMEKKISIKEELYIGYTIMRSQAVAVLMLSREGGVDIEELARTRPERIFRLQIDISSGPDEAALEKTVSRLGLDAESAAFLSRIARKLYGVFTEYECEVAEINPLVITEQGTFLAADARIAIYDEAISKHQQYAKEEDTYTQLEKQAHRQNLGYVQMDGDIGVIGNGAGLNMATLDILTYFKGRPANFLEVSGRTYHKAKEAVQIILANPNVKVIFGNFFGCISRCDVIALGISEAVKEGMVTVPMVIAMRGTGAKEGIETLKKAGLKEIYEDDIAAGERAVEILKGA